MENILEQNLKQQTQIFSFLHIHIINRACQYCIIFSRLRQPYSYQFYLTNLKNIPTISGLLTKGGEKMPELVKTWNQLVADAYEATTGEKVSESDFEHITAPRGMGRHLAKSADQEQWIIDRIIARNITLADLSYELATSEG